jgi:hypothetical protein
MAGEALRTVRRILRLALVLLAFGVAVAFAPTGDSLCPHSHEVVDRMLDLAEVKPGDLLFDLGGQLAGSSFAANASEGSRNRDGSGLHALNRKLREEAPGWA